MKKVLVLINNDIRLYNLRKELLQQLCKKGYKVYVSLPNGEKIEDIKKIGCEYIETRIDRRGINPIKDIKLLFAYKKMIEQIEPDIVLGYTIKPNIYGGIICRIKKCNFIATITGIGTSMQKRGILRSFLVFLYQISFKTAKCIFFQNEENQELFKQLHIVNNQKTILVKGSGINLEEYPMREYPSEDKIIFTFIGRIMKEKGIEEFLNMAKQIKEKYSDTSFEIIGDYEEEKYEEIIENYKQFVDYKGFQLNTRSFLQEMGCFIQPSYHEGTSNVMLEAAATGRPIIASNISGCKEIVETGVSGYLFEVKNTQKLIESVEKFLQLSYNQKKGMGVQARKKVEREYDRNLVVNSYIDEIIKY